jgi:uncharacterized protein (DUF952 family)
VSAESVWHVTRDGVPAVPGAEGFVHASFTRQLDGTLALHFAGAPQVELLLLDPARLGDALRLEASRGGEPFPHVHRELRAGDVIARVGLRRGADGGFATALLPR